jgi:tetratricopeptide (TPR) repeat protein
MSTSPRLPIGFAGPLALATLVAVAFLPTALVADFLNFDDNRLVGPGSELGHAGLLGALDPRRTVADAYLPVTHAFLWLETAVFGDRPLGFHLVSVVLQVVAAVCVHRLLLRLAVRPAVALTASAVFAVHPALAESVSWVSGQKDLLSGIFAALALTAVASSQDAAADRRVPLRAMTFALLAVYSKATAIVLIPLAWIVVLALRKRSPETGEFGVVSASGAKRAAVLITAIGIPAAAHHAAVAAASGVISSGGILERCLQVPGAMSHYLRTALWPTDLDVLYPEVKTLESFRTEIGVASIVLAIVAVLVLVARRRLPVFAVGVASFFIALAPANTALPASSIAAADRYLYLALPGLALALASLPRVGAALTGVAVLPLLVLTNARSADFRSSEALWRASLDRDPENALALLNLANARLASFGGAEAELTELRGLTAQAEAVARYPQHRWRAARAGSELALLAGDVPAATSAAGRAAVAARDFDPRQPFALEARLESELTAARLARRIGDAEAARGYFAEAETLSPGHPSVLAFDAARRFGDAAGPDGNLAADAPEATAAAAILERALATDPDSYDALWTKGLLLRATGRLLEAEVALRKAVAVAPWREEAWIARCELFLAQPNMAKTAESIAREGIIQVGDRQAAGLQFRLALALGAQGRLDDAKAFYEAALALRPGDTQIQQALAAVLGAIGVRDLFVATPDALLGTADRIAALDAGNPKGKLLRAVAYRGQKRLADALILLREVRETMSGDPEVEQLFAEALRDRGWQLWLAESDRDAAWAYFVEFLRTAPSSVDRQAVENLVRSEWERHYTAGKAALVDRDLRAAEAHLRAALALREDGAPALELAMTLLARDGEPATSREALRLCDRARDEQARYGLDRSLPVLYGLMALDRLGDREELLARARAYLAAPDVDAQEDVLARIKVLAAD